MGFIVTRKYGKVPVDDRIFRTKEIAQVFLNECEMMNKYSYRIREIDIEVPDRGDKPIFLM